MSVDPSEPLRDAFRGSLLGTANFGTQNLSSIGAFANGWTVAVQVPREVR